MHDKPSTDYRLEITNVRTKKKEICYSHSTSKVLEITP